MQAAFPTHSDPAQVGQEENQSEPLEDPEAHVQPVGRGGRQLRLDFVWSGRQAVGRWPGRGGQEDKGALGPAKRY